MRMETCGVLGVIVLVVMMYDMCDAAAIEKTNNQQTDRQHYITGGVETAECTFKHMAIVTDEIGLRHSRPRYCGGALISPEYVLTARHCLGALNAPWIVGLGKYNLTDDTEDSQYYEVWPRDAFTAPNDDADIALLRLDPPANLTDCIQPAPVSIQLPSIGTQLYVTGWGMTHPDVPIPGIVLQKLSLPRANNQVCRESFEAIDGPHNSIVLDDNTEFCAGHYDSQGPYENICEGDSGSPIHSMVNGEFHVVGIAVEGMNTNAGGCAPAGHYAVYKKISDVHQWITGTTGVQVIAPPPPPPPAPSRRRRCFPPSSTVELSSGEHLAISDVRPGDRILSLDSSGHLVYSDVVSMMHAFKTDNIPYLIISTEGHQQLTVTGEHLIYRSHYSSSSSPASSSSQDHAGGYVYAADIEVGDCVLVRSAGNSSDDIAPQPQQVTDIRHTRLDEAYAPLTTQGTILVDGVVASCYGGMSYHWLGQLAYAPIRYWYSFFPSSVTQLSLSSSTEAEIGRSDQLPEEEWYTSLLVGYGIPLVEKLESLVLG